MQFRKLFAIIVLVVFSATIIMIPYAQDTPDTSGLDTIRVLDEALQNGDLDTFMSSINSRVAFMAKDLEKDGWRIGGTDEIRTTFEDLLQDYDLSLSIIGMSEDGQLWLTDMEMQTKHFAEIGLGPVYVPLEFSMRGSQVMRLHWIMSNRSRDIIRNEMIMPPITLEDIQGTIEGQSGMYRVDFNEDGSYHIYGVNTGYAAPQDKGTYSLEGNRITLVSNDESAQCPAGSEVTWTMKWQRDYTIGIILEAGIDEDCDNRRVPTGLVHRFKKIEEDN